MEKINDLMPLSKDWNKERLTQLKHLFPDLFTNEGKLNIDELKKVVDPASVSETERFEFRWLGKSAAKRNAFTPSNATLMLDESRSVHPTESENIIIEGENLEVLKLLSGSYREKVKCIYIDPPYNTGKDFVYSDNYTQDKKAYWEENGVFKDGLKIDTNSESDGRYHSNWLNMMYSRLLIARQLLREDGVIFISIDDNEVHHLRKLCDEIFGEENFGGQIIWQTATDNNPTQIATEHEYVLCYLKDKNEQDFWEVPSDKGKIIQEKYDELKAKYKDDIESIQTELRKWIKSQTNGNDLSGVAHYSYIDEQGVYYPGNSANTKPGGYTYDIIHPITENICAKPEYGYRWPFDTFTEANKRGDVQWGDDENTIPKIKKRLDTVSQRLKSYYYEDNRATSSELKTLFGGKKVFNNPKSVNFLKHIFKFITNENDLVLDFFGGSGSTSQAIFELNTIDNFNRRYILVQIPELTDKKTEAYKAGYKKISDITIERNKRVVEKIKLEQELKRLKDKQDNPLFNNFENQANPINQGSDNLGFKVFKLVKSNFPRVEWAPDVDKTEEENIVLLKAYIKEKEAQLVTAFNRDELLTEILLKNGFQLNYKANKQDEFKQNEILLATDGIKETLICLDVVIDADTVEHFKKHTDKKFICLERALDTTKKFNLKHYLGDKFNAF
ncbi:MAG: site-specific DNA-methyltransferase [Flavobacterium sp.]|nr:site-specific DNA-methyltransferase [Flavobacterium sp.]